MSTNQPRICVVLFVRPISEELAGLVAEGKLDQLQNAVLAKLADSIGADLELDHAFAEWADVDPEGNPIVMS